MYTMRCEPQPCIHYIFIHYRISLRCTRSESQTLHVLESLYLGGNDDKLINDFLLNIWLGGGVWWVLIT